MNSLGLYPIPGSDEMPLTDIEVAVKENYHVSTQTGHNLVHVFLLSVHMRIEVKFCPSVCVASEKF